MRRRVRRLIPHSYALMVSATILLAIIGVSIVRLWQRGAVGDWALFLYGLVATTLLASVITTVLNFRRNQL